MTLTESEYEELSERFTAYEVWRNGRTSLTAAEVASAPVHISNEERSALEAYEFKYGVGNGTMPFPRYFAYVKLHDQPLLGNAQLESNRYGNVTTWMGDYLGGIYWMGRKFRGNMGDTRQNIRVRGINGRSYAGTYYSDAGDYCRLRIMRDSGTCRVIVGGSYAAKLRWPVRTYKLRSSANRRRRQIHAAHDLGIETIWILPVGSTHSNLS